MEFTSFEDETALYEATLFPEEYETIGTSCSSSGHWSSGGS
jgi:hypothetical protein